MKTILKVKNLLKAKSLFFCVVLLLVLCGCVPVRPETDSRASFYINLNDYPLYVKNGFEGTDITLPPEAPMGPMGPTGPKDESSPQDLSAGPWRLIPSRSDDPRRPASVKHSGLPGIPKRVFLSPFAEKDREYTMVIPFTVSPEQFGQINGKKPFQPGLFLATVGVNWEIFLNGHTVRSEIHLDEEGQIESGRGWRYVSLPLDSSLFVPETNLLVLRIIGPPDYDMTGLCYEQPYYIAGYETIQKKHNESLTIALCAVYIFVGIYHFLLFLSRPRDRFNLYYCGFSIVLGICFLMRSHAIYHFIPDSNITFRIEYASVFMALPLLGAFLENLSFGKTSIFVRVFGIFWLLLVIAQWIFPRPFGDDVLRIWWLTDFFAIIYILAYDMIYAFYRTVRERRRISGGPLPEVLWKALVETPLGNLIIGILLMSITATIDILSSLYRNRGTLIFSSYGFFLFTITTTIILARRFGGLFHKLDTMNTALEKANANLEATVRERTRELEYQTEVAKSASRAKSDFLARMSHEIRTPLNAILGLSEVELGKNTGLRSETMNNLENIYNSGTTLLNIVNDILDASKIESGRMELVPVEYALSNMINDAVSLNAVRIGSKPISFELVIDEAIPSKLYGDELRVRQILNNLLSNAIKYTQEGRVILDIGYERDGDHIRLICAVKDTGIGIRRKDMEKLFSEYNQVDVRSNRAIEGTGLGLSITKNLAEMMSGSISVESEYGKGSVFTVSIRQKIVSGEPLGKETAESLKNFRYKNQNREAQNLVRKPMPYARVLVVDDVVTNLAVAKGMMAPYGMIIDGVTSGQMAIEFLRKENVRYDAVFMDHMMPGMDGIEAVRIIRNEIGTEYARNIPIIALTANALVGNDLMFLENGFQAFLSKPINAFALDSILDEWVRDPARDAVLPEEPSDLPRAGSPASPSALPPDSPQGPSSPGLDAVDPLRSLEPAGIDAEAALRRLDGNREAYIEILRAFALHTPAQIDGIRRCTAETLGEYAIAVHGLKGANYGICADGAGHEAAELEAAARAGRLESVLEKNPPFIGTMEKLTAAVKAVVDSLRSGAVEKPKPRRDEPDGALLDELLDACKDYDIETMERLLSDLEGYTYESGEDLVGRLREDLDNLEYDSIRERLEERSGLH